MIHDDIPASGAVDGTAPQQRDPFGRISDNGADQEKLRAITDLDNLTAPVGPDADNKPEDVARIEMLLEKTGDMDLGPSEGPTGYVGQRLLDALAAFQRRNRLNETGIVRPNDATHRALVADAGRNPDKPSNRQSAGGQPDPVHADPNGPQAT